MDKTNLLPGMPLLSYRIWHEAYITNRVDKLQSIRIPEWENQIDVESYSILEDGKSIGKYTVRRKGDRIERNIFWFMPDQTQGNFKDTMRSSGFGGTIWEDSLRITSEKMFVLFLYLYHLLSQFPNRYARYIQRKFYTYSIKDINKTLVFALYHSEDKTVFINEDYLSKFPRGAISMMICHEGAHIFMHNKTNVIDGQEDTGAGEQNESDLIRFLREISGVISCKTEDRHIISSRFAATTYNARNYITIQSFHDLRAAHSLGSILMEYRNRLMDVVVTTAPRDELAAKALKSASEKLRSMNSQLVVGLDRLAGSDFIELSLANHFLSIKAEDYLRLLFKTVDFVQDGKRYQSFLCSAKSRIDSLIESSPRDADLLLEQLYLVYPVLPLKAYQYFKHKLIIKEAELAGQDCTHPLTMFEMAVGLERRLSIELNLLKRKSANFEQWRNGLFGLSPFLVVCSSLFNDAKTLFEQAGQMSNRNDEKKKIEACLKEQFLIEEKYCDAFATLQHNGVGYPAILPAIEQTFALNEIFPDLDNGAYKRTIRSVGILKNSRLVMPDFVSEAIVAVIRELWHRAEAQGAVYPLPIRMEDIFLYMPRNIKRLGDVFRWLLASFLNVSGIYLLLWDTKSFRFKKLINGEKSLAFYLDKVLEKKLSSSYYVDSSVMGMFEKDEGERNAS